MDVFVVIFLFFIVIVIPIYEKKIRFDSMVVEPKMLLIKNMTAKYSYVLRDFVLFIKKEKR